MCVIFLNKIRVYWGLSHWIGYTLFFMLKLYGSLNYFPAIIDARALSIYRAAV